MLTFFPSISIRTTKVCIWYLYDAEYEWVVPLPPRHWKK